MLFLLSKISKFTIVIIILSGIIQGFIPTVMLIISKYTLNEVQNLDSKAILFALVGIFVKIFSLVFGKLYGYYISKISLLFDNMISVMILEKSSELGMKDYDSKNTYDIITRAQMQGASSIITYIDSYINTFKEIITILSTMIIILVYNKLIFVVVLVLPIIDYYFSIKIVKEQYTIIKNRTIEDRKLWYIKYIATMGNTFKELEIFSLWNHIISSYKNISSKIISQDLKIDRKSVV